MILIFLGVYELELRNKSLIYEEEKEKKAANKSPGSFQ